MKICYIGSGIGNIDINKSSPEFIESQTGGAGIHFQNLIKKCVQTENVHIITWGKERQILSKRNRLTWIVHKDHLFIPILFRQNIIEPIINFFTFKKHFDKVDLCHINNFEDYGLIKTFNSNVAVIYTIQGCLLRKNSLYKIDWRRKLLDRLLLIKIKNSIRKADALIAVRPGLDPELYLYSKKYKKNIILIPNGVDIKQFDIKPKRIDLLKQLEIPDNNKIIISTSRFSYERRIDNLIKCFSLLLNKYDDVHLLLLGDGPRKQELIELVAKLKIQKQVSFVGRIPHSQIVDYYNLSDIAFNSLTSIPPADQFIYPQSLLQAIIKNYPITLENSSIESMACGKPLISVVKRVDYTDIDKNILNDDCGINISENAGQTLYEILDILLQDDKLRNTMSINARNVIVKYRNLDLIFNKIHNLYNNVLFRKI